MNRILIIAPHADDEILGCGGTIAKYVHQGADVFIIIATDASKSDSTLFSESGIAIVRKEAIEAHKLLGVKETFFLDFPAPALNAFPEYKISLALSEIIKNIRPTHLLLPHPCDLHQDHKAIYRSAIVAARPIGHLKIGNVFCYETLSETEWAPVAANNTFVPNLFIDVSDHFDKKLKAMRCYESQLKESPNSRSLDAISALATLRGATIGVMKAEAFFIERQIVL